MAARFYEAMILLIAMGEVMPEAMSLAVGWAKETAKQDTNDDDAIALRALVEVVESKILNL
jgi:hypothetical protein